MIDLHSHTTNSDGTWDTRMLLNKAQEIGLEIFSITDHDTAKAYIDIEKNKELQEIFTGKLIKGVELNCAFDGIKIEILAYDFDLHPVQEWLENYYTPEKNRNRLIEEFDYLTKICNEKGIKIEKNLRYNPEIEYPVDVIYTSITKFEENKHFFSEEQWKDKEAFYRTCTVDKDFPLYIDFSKQIPTLNFYNKFIHEHKGKIFLAHLYKYRLEDHIGYLKKMVNEKLIDGVEVYHSSFTEKQIETLKKYCINKDLLISGGSDCHGEKKKDRKLGVGYGNLNISQEIVKAWNV